MAKMKKKEPQTLAELMQDTVVEDLLLNAEVLGFHDVGVMDRMKPYQMKQYLAKQILQNPVQVLNRMSVEDLVLMQQLVDAGPGMSAVYFMNGAVPPCVMLGLIDCSSNLEERKDYYTMTDDLREAIRPHLEQAKNDFENKFRFYVESLLLGMLNIYGCCTETQLKTMLKELLELEDDGSGVFEHIYPQSAALQLCCYDYEEYEETMYASPFIFTIDSVLIERDEHPEIKQLKRFDKDEVKEAGGMPTPTLPNAFDDKLINAFQTNLDMAEPEAILMEFSVWQLLQNMDGPSEVIQHLLKKDQRVVQVMPVLVDYLNHAPQWRFSGYSADDLSKLREKMEYN